MTWAGTGTLISTPSGFGTSTRSTLRRDICRELQMPFMRKYGGFSVVAASPAPTVSSIADNKLTQENHHWKNQWWYSVTKDEVRLITAFKADSNELVFEYPATLPVAGDTYEIHSIWNADEIHAAINRAIEDAYPSFFDVVTDETLVIKENTLEYSLTGLTYSPWIITKVWVENADRIGMGKVTSAAAGTLVDTNTNFTGITSSYLVSIYSGKGAGQLRTVGSITGTTQLNVTSNWITTPDSTSKYLLWDPTIQSSDWTRLQNIRFNTKENPTKLYLPENFSSRYGQRIRLEYISKPVILGSEASITSIPKEFIIHRALHFLHGQKINDNRVDRQRYEVLAQRYFEQSEMYRQSHAFNMPEITMWTPRVSRGGDLRLDGNPMGWRDNGMEI